MENCCRVAGDGKEGRKAFRQGLSFELLQGFHWCMRVECISCESCLGEGHLLEGQESVPLLCYQRCRDCHGKFNDTKILEGNR